MRKYVVCVCFALAAVAGGAGTARAGFAYAEEVDGDFSDDRFNPTRLTAVVGANVLSGQTASSAITGDLDPDYFTVTVPAGLQLDSLVLTSYEGDGASFIGLQTGEFFPVDPVTALPGDLLGYAFLGPRGTPAGRDLLGPLAAGPGAIGFTAPLPSGTYAFWLQETSVLAAEYTLTFNVSGTGPPVDPVVPEPASLSLAAAAAVGLTLFRVRRRGVRREPAR